MKKAFFICFLLLTALLGSLAEAKEQELIELGKTSKGIAYVDASNVVALKRDGRLFVLVPMEEHFTDQAFLKKLRTSKKGMEKASKTVYLYMFNNVGTEYCIPKRFVADEEGFVCADLGTDMQLKPVNNSVVLVKAYEAAYTVLEKKKRFAEMIQ